MRNLDFTFFVYTVSLFLCVTWLFIFFQLFKVLKKLITYIEHGLNSTHYNMAKNCPDKATAVFVGPTNGGKTTICNMLCQGELRTNNLFPTADTFCLKENETTRKGVTLSNKMEVWDTVGFGKKSKTKVSENDAINEINKFAASMNFPINYICIVISGRERIDTLTKQAHDITKLVFKGDTENNIVFIITGKDNGWLDNNYIHMFKAYNIERDKIIAVDFPEIDRRENMEAIRVDTRKCSLDKLEKFFDKLNFDAKTRNYVPIKCEGIGTEDMKQVLKLIFDISQTVLNLGCTIASFVGCFTSCSIQ